MAFTWLDGRKMRLRAHIQTNIHSLIQVAGKTGWQQAGAFALNLFRFACQM